MLALALTMPTASSASMIAAPENKSILPFSVIPPDISVPRKLIPASHP
jgi:hypothetical protein